jgi:hypothetical protein
VAANFAADVESIVGPVLRQLGFALDEVDGNVDEGGRQASVVYYRSVDAKVQVYESAREGNVNCMIAPLSAPNEFGPLDRSLNWRFLNEFSPAPDVPIEDLVKSVSYQAKGTAQQLEEVRDRLSEYYQDAHTGILQENGDR